MNQLLEILSHPLVLLTAGAALSGWLIPRLTQRWQDQRKTLELKAELVERVTRAVMDIATATQFVEVGAVSQSQADFDKSYRSWQLEKAILTSVLGAYFRSREVSEAWLRCRALATAYYTQVGIRRTDPEATELTRQAYLRAVASGLARHPPEDLSEDPVSFSGAVAMSPPARDLADLDILRDELRGALSAAINAMVDARTSLTDHS